MVAWRLTSVRSLARFLADQPAIAKACGFKKGKVPSYRTLCRRFPLLNSQVREWSQTILGSLIEKLKALKLKILIFDGTPCRSKCKKPKDFGARTRKSDPEARFGCYSLNGKKEWFFGYKSLIIASSEPLIVPLAWQVIPANLQEIDHFIPLVSEINWLLEKGKRYELVADSGIDSKANYDFAKKLNIRLTCPLNKRAGKLIRGQRLKRQNFYQSRLGQKLFKRRSDIERLNSQIKDLFLIDPFPVKGIKNINTYLSLVMLFYLASVYFNFKNQRNLREIKSIIA